MAKYSCFFLLFLLICCAEKPQTDSDMIVFKQDQIETIDKIPFDADEFIDSCIFVKLETTDISLIGDITQLATFEGDFYIYDQKTKKIKVFDQAGKFLRDIGKLGQGPQEYLSISAFVINPKDRKIAIFDPAKKNVLEYSLDGSYLRSVSLPDQECAFFKKTVYAGDYIYCYMTINYVYNNAYVVLSSEDYAVKDRFYSYLIHPDDYMAFNWATHPFIFFDEKLHYASLFSDTIFAYENGTKRPYLFVETGKPNIPLSYLKNRKLENDPSKAFREVFLDKSYSSGFTELGETNHFILVTHKLGEAVDDRGVVKSSYYLLNKKSKTGYYVESGFIPDFGKPDLVDGNKFIRIWDQTSIEAYQNQIKAKRIECPEAINSLLKGYDPFDDNPILAVYYMKEK